YMYEILEKWGIKYVDLYKTIAPMRYIENIKTTYTRNSDGWHPNKLGYDLFYCDPIESFMKTL
ncbi:hypothetical protein, partial [Paraburkholderia sp. SIMBA_054]|uniref:hypothetical protein n=1 Tax=Paraburkholderia sp. SIMBA_054 TaxID=3085795 RepID=UPI00397A0D7A